MNQSKAIHKLIAQTKIMNKLSKQQQQPVTYYYKNHFKKHHFTPMRHVRKLRW